MNIDEIKEHLAKKRKEVVKFVGEEVAKERELDLLRNYRGNDEVISWDEIAETVRNSPDVEKLVSGLETFDTELRGGIERGRLVVLSAGTKSGKTTIAIDFMRKYEKHNPCLILLEQPPEELIREQIFYGNDIPKVYSPKSFNRVSMNWLEKRILESYLKYGTKVVVIDHLDFIERNEKMNNRHLQIQEIMEDLKLMSRRLNTTIFLVSHINKLSPEEQPTHFHLAESSSIAKLSDIVVFLWRECIKTGGKLEYTGLVNLRIDISRQGGSGTDIKLVFEKGKYREADQFEIADSETKKDNLRDENKKKKY